MRKIFLDCGGYDGCSAIKYLRMHPEFECISFEPNAALHGYYRILPVQLVKKAAYIHDGHVDFVIDPVDGDGSSIEQGKKVDYTDTLPNDACPVVVVPCLDLSRYILQNTSASDYIVLKLDVEGSEYKILEKIIDDGALEHINELHCEFHWDKIGLSRTEHDNLVNKLKSVLAAETWNAMPFSVHAQPYRYQILRMGYVSQIYFMQIAHRIMRLARFNQ